MIERIMGVMGKVVSITRKHVRAHTRGRFFRRSDERRLVGIIELYSIVCSHLPHF